MGEGSGNSFIDLGRFLTGFFVVMGIGELSSAGARGRQGEHEPESPSPRIQTPFTSFC